jgi:hypothetical protein
MRTSQETKARQQSQSKQSSKRLKGIHKTNHAQTNGAITIEDHEDEEFGEHDEATAFTVYGSHNNNDKRTAEFTLNVSTPNCFTLAINQHPDVFSLTVRQPSSLLPSDILLRSTL